jgi:hypothetical protein
MLRAFPHILMAVQGTREGTAVMHCLGTVGRRDFVRSGLVGLSAIGLADLLRMQSQAAPSGAPRRSMILLWLWGGPSHMETFDLKPDAPSEYRGEFRPIPTNVPGIEISEHLPLLAKHADKFALVRSLHHDSPGHVNATHTMLTGNVGELVETPPFEPKYPDARAVIHKVLGSRSPELPPHIALPYTKYFGSAYLGGQLNPLTIAADPSGADFKSPVQSIETALRPRFDERINLLGQLDRYRRELDAAGSMANLDQFQQQAATVLTSESARRAFDLSAEDTATRDRYGRHAVGQRCLLARRLVEAGARLVTVDFSTVPGQKAFSWDDHASVWNIFEQMKIRLPVLDQVVSALIQDIYERALQDEILLVVMGEMSHTPRLSNFEGQPGREHWGQTMSVLLSGGGLQMGQVVGATSAKGDEPSQRPVTPNDLLATWYHSLGVPLELSFRDFAGRPTPILPSGEPIVELTG